MKTKKRKLRQDSYTIRNLKTTQWRTRVFNLFMQNYDIGGLNRDEREFILRNFWGTGRIGAIRLSDDPLILGFPQYAIEGGINYYGQPVKARCMQRSGIQLFPDEPFDIYKGEDTFDESKKYMVIGYATRSHDNIQDIAFSIIDEIVNVEMAIRTNVYAQKLPLLIAASPENKDELDDLVEDAFNDELKVTARATDRDSIQTLSNLPAFNKDLVDYRKILINELYTFLGFDNNGQLDDKKERVGSDEINANNDIINRYGDSVYICMKEFFDDCNFALGSSITFEKRYKTAVKSIHDTDDRDVDDIDNGGDDDAK